MADFTPKIKSEETKPESRNVLNRLPSFLQDHKDIKRFFKGVANHFFEPAQVEEVSGFVGRRSTVFDPNDFYIQETTRSRQNYQLEPTAVSVDEEKNINYFKFYEDLVDNLRVQGSLTRNHSRLFESEFWSWCPPINPDMLINFSNYFWLEEGPPIFEITEQTNVVLNMIGKENFIFPDGTEAQSGMRVIFRDDDNTEYNDINFILVDVGRSIALLDDREFDDAVSGSTDQDYIVMERGSRDQNAWSTRNRWFHRNQISDVNLTNFIVVQARRPIIQFESNIQLRNMGRKARIPVNVWHKGPLSSIQGVNTVSINGVLIEDGMRILVTGESTEGQNNIVYRVTGKEETGVYVLVKEIDGTNIDGTPAEDEILRITQGTTLKDKRVYWDQTVWIEGQEKTTVNQYPQFELYDLTATRLDDEGVYPESTFNGSFLFGFKEDNTNDIDPFLGLRITFNSFGEIIYDNFINSTSYSYTESSTVTSEIEGLKFFRINGKSESFDSYETDWRNPGWLSRQTVSDTWQIKEQETSTGTVEFPRSYKLSQIPETEQDDKFQTFRLFLNGSLLEEGIDYSITNDQLELSLTLDLANNDFLDARSFDRDKSNLNSERGFYRIPTNLQANPNNEGITDISYNEMFEHFISIIENQQGLEGRPYGVNNFNSTVRNLSAGTEIIQNSSSILKLMFLNQNKTKNIRSAIRFVSLEYQRWYSKFSRKAELQTNQDQLSDYASIDDFIDEIIEQLNSGKDQSIFPFFNSGMIDDGLYIPPTPSFLGFGIIWEPGEFIDDTIPDRTIKWRRGHDGSLSQVVDSDLDTVMLRLEQRIYASIDDKFKGASPNFSHFDVMPGHFRESAYTLEEWNTIMRPHFENWAFQNGIDHKPNTTHDSTDPFTFNYSRTPDRYGNTVPGNWRGIYRHYFDTDRPHSHPWEMLGLGEKPSWWNTEYGTAPYTRENIELWTDIENGNIAQGDRIGIDPRFIRTGLSSVIPVDSAGNLLDPIASGIIPTTPPPADSTRNWKFGDVSPIEWIWRISNLYSFDLASTTYLARPAEFIEKTWDAFNYDRYFRNQIQTQVVYTPLGRRISSSEEAYHSNSSRQIGSQQWMADYWLSLGLNQTTDFADLLNDMTVQLGYRTGSFIDIDGFRITSDNFGRVPNEDITTVLTQSSSRREPTYSALIVRWDGTNYRVRGYDPLYPTLTFFKPDLSGKKSSFTSGRASATLFSKYGSTEYTYEYDDPLQSTQEMANLIEGYGKFLENNGWIFDEYLSDSTDINNWKRMAKVFINWAGETREEGDVLFLSPFSSEAAFESEFGLVDEITQYTNGSWTALDYEGIPMRTESFKVSRVDNTVTITHKNDEPLALLRLTLIEYDHAMIFENITRFENLIYDPKINLRQRRFRVIGNRVKFWNGRFDAPGYLITDSTVIPNYDTNSENIRKFYDPYAIGVSSEALKHARHLVGYQKKSHMEDMLLDDRSQFNFFRGFLSEKGTTASFDRLLRSTYIRNSQEDFEIYEEWAFKVGEYGARDIQTSLEFSLLQSEMKSDPQTVTFSTDTNIIDSKLDQVITIPFNDDRWIRTATNSFQNKFAFRNFNNILGKDLPTGGWAQLGETDFLVANEEEFSTLYEDQSNLITEGQDVWIVKDNKGDWDIRRFNRLGKIISIEAGSTEEDPVTIRTFEAHGLVVNDIIVIPETTDSTPDYQGTQTVSAIVDDYEFQISTPATEGKVWTTIATSIDQSPVTFYGENFIINSTNILLTTINPNTFSTAPSPNTLNLGGKTLTIDGNSLTFVGNIVTGLQTNPKIRSTEISTAMILDDYPIIFEHTNQLGSVINPTVTVDASSGMYINGTDVVWTGTGDLDSIVSDINSATINRIFAKKGGVGNNQLQLWNLADEQIDLRSVGVIEDALEQLGFGFDTTATGTNTSPTVTVDASNGININGTVVVFTGAGDAAAVVNDITTAAITNITAAVEVGGAVEITHGIGGDIFIFNIDITEDAVEVLGFTQTFAGKTTADYVSDINTAIDTSDIEATDFAGKIQLEKKDGNEIIISDTTGTPSISFGLRSSYPARTITQIVGEVTGAGITATEEADGSIAFTYDASEIIAVSGTAITKLGLSSEYKSIVSYAEIVTQISAASIPDVEFSSVDGFLTFKNLDTGDLTFAGTAREDLGFDEIYAGDQFGPDVFTWATMRRSSVSNVGTIVPLDGWVSGDRQFVDADLEINLGLASSGNKRWSVYEYNGSSWMKIRHQEDRIDTPLIESVYLFDKISNQTINKMFTWDPVKKIIPGTAMSEIFYTIEVDPAVYNAGDDTSVVQNNNRSWSIEQAGRLWWDLNAVRYLDYEQGELSYRRKYWGRKLVGSTIDIYEWTRSPVPPAQWNEFVSDQAANASSDYLPSGTVKNSENPAWVEKVEFDKRSNQNKTFYYFWVLNPRFRPNKPFRRKSAFEVKTIIDDPYSAGVLFFSPIESSSLINIYSSTFLVGNITDIVTNDDVILQINFRKNPEDDENVYKEWVLIREDSDDNIDDSIWNKMKYSLVGEDNLGQILPDSNLNESRKYGINIRPRQSMFEDRENARRSFVDESNRIFLRSNIVDNVSNWETTFMDKDPEPTSFDFQVITRLERDALSSNPLFEAGMTVLILEDELDDNKWSHWSYDGVDFTLIDKEEYDVQNYWSYTDWYDPDLENLGGSDSGDGVSIDSPPTTIFATTAERDASHPDSIIAEHNLTHPNGHIVIVLDNGEGRWIWSQYQDNGSRVFWRTVAVEDGTIQLNNRLFSFDLADADLELEGKIVTEKLVDYFDS